jgi:glycine dehydrogenase subunit 1
LRRLAEQNLAKAHYAAAELSKVQGASMPFSAAHFNEFVVKAPGDAEELLAGLREEKIIGGLHLDRFYPELKDHLLVCVTETVPRSALNRMVGAWREFAGPVRRSAPEEAVASSNR